VSDLDYIVNRVVGPGLALLPTKMDSDKARLMLLAIGLQESRFEHRRQIGGPARGFWQFEKGGGVRGVLTHQATKWIAIDVCRERGVDPTESAVYPALEKDDLLACAFARLLLYTDPRPLPAPGYVAAAWDYYIRNWRPGKPHRQTWDVLYAQAWEATQ
jgi:hypothetical protein